MELVCRGVGKQVRLTAPVSPCSGGLAVWGLTPDKSLRCHSRGSEVAVGGAGGTEVPTTEGGILFPNLGTFFQKSQNPVLAGWSGGAGGAKSAERAGARSERVLLKQQQLWSRFYSRLWRLFCNETVTVPMMRPASMERGLGGRGGRSPSKGSRTGCKGRRERDREEGERGAQRGSCALLEGRTGRWSAGWYGAGLCALWRAWHGYWGDCT